MKRPDGFYIKDINPYQKMIPHIMPTRNDAVNYYNTEIRSEGIDKFIKEQAELGKHYSYTEIIVTSIVRMMARRPQLNRFVMNRKIYQHFDICLAFTIKKQLNESAEDTVVKIHFTGEENLDDVKAKVEEAIAESTIEDEKNGVDKTAATFAKMPHWMFKFGVKFLNFLDNKNMCPKKIIEVSPFHNSGFITFLGSIKGNWIFHHCYNFGTTGIFIGVGKDKDKPVVEDGEVKVGRVLPFGLSADERICDGMYFINSVRMWQILLSYPKSLQSRYVLGSDEPHPYPPLSGKEKREAKRQAKLELKVAKQQQKLKDEAEKQQKKIS